MTGIGGGTWGARAPINFFERESAPTKFEVWEGTLARRHAVERDTCLATQLTDSQR